MSDLTHLWPVPEPVTLAEQPFLAVCFQLRNLARLQAIAGSLKGHPLHGRRVPLIAAREAAGGDYLAETAEGHVFAALLRGAIRACQGWPPSISGKEGEALLATRAGLALWIDILLSRTNPGFTAATAAELLETGRVTAEEMLHLHEVAYADYPGDVVDRIADPMPRRKPKPVKWGEEIARFSEAHPAYTIEETGSLYLSQWYMLRSAGRWEPGTIPGPVARVREVAARRRRLMGGGRENGTGH